MRGVELQAEHRKYVPSSCSGFFLLVSYNGEGWSLSYYAVFSVLVGVWLGGTVARLASYFLDDNGSVVGHDICCRSRGVIRDSGFYFHLAFVFHTVFGTLYVLDIW